MYLKKQVFFVLGLSRSGRAAAEYLLNAGSVVYIYDDMESERVEQIAQDLENMGAKRLKKEELNKAVDFCDALVLSPGIPIDHPMAIAFKRKGKALLGETELAAREMRSAVIAITGTNGKTTSVSMLTQILEKGGLHAKACGNIGLPMIDFCGMGKESIAVAEISSFQMETLNSLRPHIAVILNITEDHLNRHYTMENYIFLKAKLLKNLTETEYAILNYDDPIVREFGEKTKAKVLYFSTKQRVVGAYYEDGDLYIGKEKILSAKELPFEGLHNIENVLSVILAAKLMGVGIEDIRSAIMEFKGVKHRLEFIAEIDGVEYIDDSKGTNVDATIKAVDSMKKETILLLGGKHKGYDYAKLFDVLRNSKVVHAVLYGENRYALLKNAREKEYNRVTLCEGFDFAVRIAAMKANSGQTVLLSPASASFDEFASYEERGDRFVEIVRSLERQNKEAQNAVVILDASGEEIE